MRALTRVILARTALAWRRTAYILTWRACLRDLRTIGFFIHLNIDIVLGFIDDVFFSGWFCLLFLGPLLEQARFFLGQR